MKALLVLALASLAFTPAMSKAEGGCPPGQYPQQGQGWKTCVPIQGYQSPSAPDQPLPPKWKTNWQALAADMPKGIIGTARDQVDRATAEQRALQNCAVNGGTACKIHGSVGNGCLAMVVGESTTSFDSGSTQEQATGSAMESCKGENQSCEVYFELCNAPARVN